MISLSFVIPVKKYPYTHPETFSLVLGKRRDREGSGRPLGLVPARSRENRDSEGGGDEDGERQCFMSPWISTLSKDDTMNLPDFDELVAMAESSPEELDRLRREMVERIIESTSNEVLRRRLRGLQFQIDAKIRKARTPLAACIMISQMMHDSLLEMRERLLSRDPIQCLEDAQAAASAEVVSLQEARQRLRKS